MKKTLGIIRHGDHSTLQKIKAKCEAKQKDKNSTYDTCANTKSSMTLRGKKTNNSSAQAFSETTLNSQVLCDLSYKEPSILKANTSKVQVHPEKPVPITGNQNHGKIPKVLINEIERVLEERQREGEGQEDVQSFLFQEIDEAIQYLDRNRKLPEVIAEQDKTIHKLRAKLQQVVQKNEQMKLYHKRRSIPAMNQNSQLLDQRVSIRGDNSDRHRISKMKSLSPPFLMGVLEKDNRFNMYKENPAKALISSYLKSKAASKTSRESIKPLYLGNVKKKGEKPSQSGRQGNPGEEETKSKVIQSNREHVSVGNVVVNKNKEVGKEIEERKGEIEEVQRPVEMRRKREGENEDVYGNIVGLFEKYVELVERCKFEARELTVRNMNLEKRIKEGRME